MAMKLSDIMTTDVRCLTPQSLIREAAELMATGNFGVVPVCEDGQLKGIVTDRDIVVRGLAQGRSIDDEVSVVMSPDVCYAFDDQGIEDAAELMEERQIRRLPILNHANELVGIVSLGDIAIEVRRDDLTGEVLERVSEPTHL